MMNLVVLSCLLAAASAAVPFYGFAAPIAYSAPLLQPYNYRGPLSLAPGQPANVLGADGRPLDTLDVNLDRSAHLTAKAFDGGIHLLKKRSVPVIAAPLAAAYAAPFTTYAAYAAPLIQPYNYRGPLSLAPGQPANILGADGRPLDTLDVNLDRSAHIAAKLNSDLHILKKRSAAIIASPVAPIATVASAPLITSYRYTAPIATPVLPISYAAPYARIF